MNTILTQFGLTGRAVSCARYGNGHINETYRVLCDDNSSYILQKISTVAFADPVALMENIRLVTAHLAARARDRRSVLCLVPAKDGAVYVRRGDEYWRMYEFVRDSACVDRAETPWQFRQSAVAFGRFFNELSDFDASLLSETIPHFHDTPARYAAFRDAVKTDAAGRARTALREIDLALCCEPFSHTLTDMLSAGELPLRVTHNDTKINNVLFDANTGEGLCVIDLDTVMPGLIGNDFGDSIRFGASTAAEDEQDLSRVEMDLHLFETYLSGYLETCGASLTRAEKETLPAAAKMMTLECGVRFLTDYLNGDVYFHTAYPEHNLHRARTQLKLVQDMDKKWSAMQAVLKGYLHA